MILLVWAADYHPGLMFTVELVGSVNKSLLAPLPRRKSSWGSLWSCWAPAHSALTVANHYPLCHILLQGGPPKKIYILEWYPTWLHFALTHAIPPANEMTQFALSSERVHPCTSAHNSLSWTEKWTDRLGKGFLSVHSPNDSFFSTPMSFGLPVNLMLVILSWNPFGSYFVKSLRNFALVRVHQILTPAHFPCSQHVNI